MEVQAPYRLKPLPHMAGMVRRMHISKQVKIRRICLSRKANTRLRKTAAAAEDAKGRNHSRIDTYRAIWRSVLQVCPWSTNYSPHGKAQICAAIPSKGRWERKDFIDHAVHVLLRHGLKQRDIYVFVIADEYDLYQHSLDEAALWEVHLIIGRDGLTAQMNYMRRFFPVGTIILGCNDLLGDIVQKQEGQGLVSMPPGMLLQWAHHAYAMMRRSGVFLCGLSPSAAAMKMSSTNISRRFGLVSGTLYLEINRRRASLVSRGSGLIWDLEHTCRFWQTDGMALRYLMFAAVCKYRQAGGHSDSYSSTEARVAVTDHEIKVLAIAFPEWVKYTPQKYQSTSAFNYTCVPMGGYPLKLKISNNSAQSTRTASTLTSSARGSCEVGMQV